MSHPDVTFLQEYLQPLVNGKVVSVGVNEDDEGAWPVIVVESPTGETFTLEVSRDEEGNGPGFLFGLPIPRMASQKPEIRR